MARCWRELGGVAFFLLPSAGLADVNAYVSLTTDYVFRGVSYSDSGPAAQAGVDLNHDSGAFAGLWASTLDIGDNFGQQRDLEIAYYLGYGSRFGDAGQLTGTVVAFRYPETAGPFDYSFEEVGLSLNYDDRWWVEYAYSPDLYGTGYDTHNVEVFGEWRLPLDLTGGLGAGWYDLSRFTKTTGYAYWQAGLSRRFGRVGIDLRYHDTNRWVPFFSSAGRADARFVLSARYQF